ncbi:hypothetical protein [Pseudoalteromonas caenipelagi]|nr:hypothetical protein [Pseudoalteromonas caenipelagi]
MTQSTLSNKKVITSPNALKQIVGGSGGEQFAKRSKTDLSPYFTI